MGDCVFPPGRPRFMKRIRQEFNTDKKIRFIEVEFEDLNFKDLKIYSYYSHIYHLLVSYQ